MKPAALTAKAIRVELKKAFPSVKFSVTSESFSGGNAVDVSYEDGPTADQVRKITSKYQYGSFDGMTDSYNHDNRRTDIPQTKYVQVRRDKSDAAQAELLKEVQANYHGCENLAAGDYSPEQGEYIYTLIHRIFATRDYTAVPA